jgi:precorrin-6B methylase 1
MYQLDNAIAYQRDRRIVIIGENAPSDRVRALVQMGIGADTAAVFGHAGGDREKVMQLAKRKGLTR